MVTVLLWPTFKTGTIPCQAEIKPFDPGYGPHVVYFDQLLGAAHTRKLVEKLLWGRFQPFLLILKVFKGFKVNFHLKCSKNVENGKKISTSFWVHAAPEADQNTQHPHWNGYCI